MPNKGRKVEYGKPKVGCLKENYFSWTKLVSIKRYKEFFSFILIDGSYNIDL